MTASITSLSATSKGDSLTMVAY